MAARMEVMRGILTVGDSAGRQVLQRRYLMGQSFAEIADAMGVVQRRVYQLHHAAVERMEPERRRENISRNFAESSRDFIVFHNQ